jgi:Domain of unknown function (DUF4383)
MEASRELIERARRVGRREGAARTIAQSFCLLIGAGLIAVGVLGFVFGGSGFDVGGDVQGDDLIIFEVNGWHNVVHIATGAFLVVMSVRAAAAAIGALIFGLVYAAVAVWGFADGNDVIDLVATDAADNWLHVGLAALGALVGLLAGALGVSARREHRRLESEVAEVGAAGGPAAAAAGRPKGRRFLRRRPDQRTTQTEAAEREPAGTTETGRRE